MVGGSFCVAARLGGGICEEALLVATDGVRCCGSRVVLDGAVSVV